MTPHTAVNCRVQAMHSTHCLYMKLRCYIISMVTPLALVVTVGLAKGREKGCTVHGITTNDGHMLYTD